MWSTIVMISHAWIIDKKKKKNTHTSQLLTHIAGLVALTRLTIIIVQSQMLVKAAVWTVLTPPTLITHSHTHTLITHTAHTLTHLSHTHTLIKRCSHTRVCLVVVTARERKVQHGRRVKSCTEQNLIEQEFYFLHGWNTASCELSPAWWVFKTTGIHPGREYLI